MVNYIKIVILVEKYLLTVGGISLVTKMQASRNKIEELQSIISRMPVEVFCKVGLPELDVTWRDVFTALRQARLPMHPASVARVIATHVSDTFTDDRVDDLVPILRLKLVATQSRTWHVIRLVDKCLHEPATETMRALSGRVAHILKQGKNRGMRPEVITAFLGDLLYLSVQLVSEHKGGPVLYLATPPGQPVALVSSVTMAGLTKACVEGLGYKKHENAKLHGRDVFSLLRINDRGWNSNADQLAQIPEYTPLPVITNTGIDYTNRAYDENYVDNILGPNPPLLTDLNIKSTKPFFDPSILRKTISLTVSLKSDDVAKTLKCWVMKGALAPTSDFIQIFHQIKSNRIDYSRQDSD